MNFMGMLVVDGFGHTVDIDLDEIDSSDASSDGIHLITLLNSILYTQYFNFN